MDISKNNKNIDVQKIMKRALIKGEIQDSIEQTLNQRIDRYLEIDHQGIPDVVSGIVEEMWENCTAIIQDSKQLFKPEQQKGDDQQGCFGWK